MCVSVCARSCKCVQARSGGPVKRMGIFDAISGTAPSSEAHLKTEVKATVLLHGYMRRVRGEVLMGWLPTLVQARSPTVFESLVFL